MRVYPILRNDVSNRSKSTKIFTVSSVHLLILPMLPVGLVRN